MQIELLKSSWRYQWEMEGTIADQRLLSLSAKQV